MKTKNLTSKLVFKSICLFLSFFVLFSVSIPVNKIIAQTYDIVIETEIDEETVKILEINYSQDIVNFYKFDSNGLPEYESGEQAKYYPGDDDYQDYVNNTAMAIITNNITIQSNQEFSFQLYYVNYFDWKMVLQLCYDGSSGYRLYEHHELDDPFDVNSVIGDFSILFVGELTYTGYKYVSDFLEEEWDRLNTQGNNSESNYAKNSTEVTNTTNRIRFKLTGTTSAGKNIKIEDKGDGAGPKVYTGEDKNKNGKIDDDEWTEVTDLDKIEEIMNEVTNDLENGLGDYEGEAWDTKGTTDTSDDEPADAIIWLKNSDGTYSGFKITRNGLSWDLDGANKVSLQWMADHGYIPHGTDPNPIGAWFVCGKNVNDPNYAIEKYARFDENGNLDEDGEQKPYTFLFGSTIKPTPVGKDQDGKYARYRHINSREVVWP
ncbi:MAG: hypothetical protein PHD83_01025 [Caldisericia bacterium]|nr:hypothetical protein [Caldisericia bacterium]